MLQFQARVWLKPSWDPVLNFVQNKSGGGVFKQYYFHEAMYSRHMFMNCLWNDPCRHHTNSGTSRVIATPWWMFIKWPTRACTCKCSGQISGSIKREKKSDEINADGGEGKTGTDTHRVAADRWMNFWIYFIWSSCSHVFCQATRRFAKQRQGSQDHVFLFINWLFHKDRACMRMLCQPLSFSSSQNHHFAKKTSFFFWRSSGKRC